jgi:hypothetical protein
VSSNYKTISCQGGCGRTDCVTVDSCAVWWCAACVEAEVAACALQHGQFTAWSRFRAGRR